jgi:molecular chaperone Hsp33
MISVVMTASDHLIRAIARESHVRVATVLTTSLVAEAARGHQLSPAATVALGRGLTAGLLLATLTKGKERVTLQILGKGPLGSITVDANGAGEVRGYVSHPQADIVLPAGRQQIGALVGRNGVVSLLRDLGLKDLYQGQTAILTGEVDEDVENYLQISEQVPSALGCEVVLDERGGVLVAAGVLVQAMPGSEPDSVTIAQGMLRGGRLYDILAAGERSTRAMGDAIWGPGLEIVGDERPLRFQCHCTPERIANLLAMLGTKELDEMIAENKPAEVVCNYCSTKYRVERPELERLRAVADKPREPN